MTYLEALLYGMVQGITEYLPVSSSAHLILVPKFLQKEDPGLTFDVFLHVGTLLATLAYFWKDWWQIGKTLPFIGSGANSTLPLENPVLSWQLIVVATIPALVAGALMHGWVETIFRGNQVLVGTLIIGGLILFLSDHYMKRDRFLKSAGWKDALWVGIAQCFALIPGISRSGSTMTGARLLGFDRESAARFSFLISAPVTAAAIVYEFKNWERLVNQASVGMGPLFVAGMSSFLFGCLAIGGLLRLLKRFGYLSFAVYRILLAVWIYYALGVDV